MVSKSNNDDLSVKYVFVLPDIKDMANKLKISESTVNKYLKAFSEYGVIHRFSRLGLGGKIVYVIGERSYYQNKETKEYKPRIIKYLKSTNKELIKRLGNFKLS